MPHEVIYPDSKVWRFFEKLSFRKNYNLEKKMNFERILTELWKLINQQFYF